MYFGQRPMYMYAVNLLPTNRSNMITVIVINQAILLIPHYGRTKVSQLSNTYYNTDPKSEHKKYMYTHHALPAMHNSSCTTQT